MKEKGVEVYFEKENIYTFDGKGELLITIMSSLAQEESRSISENVTWGQRKRFADGKVSMPYKRFLGYDKGPDGTPVVNEEQAEIVRMIFRRFLEGKLLLPMDPAEQAAIAEVAITTQAELACIDAEIDALIHQKRGLMQKLLTGEWRVTVDPTTPSNPAGETQDGR